MGGGKLGTAPIPRGSEVDPAAACCSSPTLSGRCIPTTASLRAGPRYDQDVRANIRSRRRRPIKSKSERSSTRCKTLSVTALYLTSIRRMKRRRSSATRVSRYLLLQVGEEHSEGASWRSTHISPRAGKHCWATRIRTPILKNRTLSALRRWSATGWPILAPQIILVTIRCELGR